MSVSVKVPRDLNYHEDATRTGATLPVAGHLRPRSRLATDTWCPVYTRLVAPADRLQWRWDDVLDLLDVQDAFSMHVAGEA